MSYCPFFEVYCDEYDPEHETCTLEDYACPFYEKDTLGSVYGMMATDVFCDEIEYEDD